MTPEETVSMAMPTEIAAAGLTEKKLTSAGAYTGGLEYWVAITAP